MNLKTDNWKEFLLFDYFNIIPGKYHYPEEYEEGTTPYYSASNENNGIVSYINLKPDFDGNCVVTGKVGCTAFYAPEPFCATSDVNVFKPKFDMSPAVGMFVANIINFNENYKWAYGRQCRVGNSKRIVIKLPATEAGTPDWQFMEDYIKSLHHKPLTTKNKTGQAPDLNVENWCEFRVGDIFLKRKVKHFSAMPEVEGNMPFVSSTSVNNGIAAYVDENGIDGNCITVSTNGDCFYQPSSFALSNDAEALYNKNLNEYNAMFIISVMTLEKIKYGYGRKPKNDKVYDTIIRLPITPSGEPDWQFMEDYIKSLPYGDRLDG